jgi:hypothetical protein
MRRNIMNTRNPTVFAIVTALASAAAIADQGAGHPKAQVQGGERLMFEWKAA